MGILDEQQGQQVPEKQPEEKGSQQNESAQEAFDKFTVNALKIIHTPKVADGIIGGIKSAKDKVEAVGDASLQIVNRLEESGSENGATITANTVMNGMNVIVAEIANLSKAAGVHKLNDEEQRQAFSWAISNYINNAIKSGKISKEELAQLSAQMEQTQVGQAVNEKFNGGGQQMPADPMQQPGQQGGV